MNLRSQLLFSIAVMVLAALALVPEGHATVLYSSDCSVNNWSFSGGGGGVGVAGGRCYVSCGGGGAGANGWTDDPHVNLSTSGVIMIDFVDWNQSVTPESSWFSMTDVAHVAYASTDNIVGFNFGGAAGDLRSNGYNTGDENDTGFDAAANTNYNITLTYDYGNGIYNISVNGEVKGSANYAHNAPVPAWIDAISVQFSAYDKGNVSWSSICVRNGSTEFGCVNASSPPVVNESVSITSPANESFYNSVFNVNFTIEGYGKSTTTYVYWANSSNPDFGTGGSCGSQVTSDGNYSQSCDLTAYNDDGYWVKVCVNATNPQTCDLEDVIFVTFDTTDPVISFVWPVYPSGSLTNESSNFLNISVSDSNLNEVEVNVSCGGVTKFYNLSTGLVDTVNFTQEVTWGGLDGVNCFANVTASDDHTKKEIEDYEVSKTANSLTYVTEEGLVVFVESKDADVYYVNSVKGVDRYDFRINGSEKSKDKFFLNCSGELKEVTRYGYPAFVCTVPGSLYGNWIDFNTGGIEGFTVKAKDGGFDVEIDYVDSDDYRVFSSVGGLNVVSQVATFTVDNVAPSFLSIFPSDPWNNPTNSQLFYGVVNETLPDVLYLWTNMSGTWNRTYNWTGWAGLDNLSVTFNYTDTLGWRLWAFEAVDFYGNVNMTSNFTIVPYYNKTVNFTFWNEVTGFLINDENVSITGSSVYGVFNLNTSNGSIVYDLRSPANWTLTYSAPGRSERTYEFNATGSAFETLVLYLGNNTQDVVFTVIDEFDELVEGAVIRVYRYSTSIGDYVLVDTVTTDFQGQALSDITLDTELYYFEVSYGGVVVRTTNPAYVIDTTLIITVNIGAGTSETNQDTGRGISYLMVPDGVLNNDSIYEFGFNITSGYWNLTSCSLVLNDGTGSLLQTGNVTNIGSSCVSTLVYNVTGVSNVTLVGSVVENGTFTVNFTRAYYVKVVSEGQFSLKNFIDDLSSFGEAGFNDFTRALISFVVIFVLVVVISKYAGLSNPDGIVLVILGGVLFFSYAGWLYLSFVPDIGNLRQYLIMYLSSLLGLGIVLWRKT